MLGEGRILAVTVGTAPLAVCGTGRHDQAVLVSRTIGLVLSPVEKAEGNVR